MTAPTLRTLCVPAHPCRQAADCARNDPRRCDLDKSPIDASNLRHSGGLWCPMFIDARFRNLSLLEAA
jgi:hypothetical protein